MQVSLAWSWNRAKNWGATEISHCGWKRPRRRPEAHWGGGGGTFNCIDHPGIQAWIMWKRALDIPQTSSRLLGLNISIFIASLIQLCTRHRAKFPFFKTLNRDWCKRRRNAFRGRRTVVLFGCVGDDGSLHFKVNNTECFLHPLLFHNDTVGFFFFKSPLSVNPALATSH